MITGRTALVGIMGDPVEHSLSPPMHNAAFKHLNLDYVYVPFRVHPNKLQIAIEGGKSLGFKGLNVTIPHKKSVLPFLDDLDNEAALIGAVNTIKFDDDRILGFNTDGKGAVKALQKLTPVKGDKVIIIGAGGSSRAIAFSLALSGVSEILIANRTLEKAYNLAHDLEDKLNFIPQTLTLDELPQELKDTNILINTTPVGMYPHVDQKPLINADMMHPDLLVNDIIYNPLETRLLKEARKAGAKTLNGTHMLINQGMEAFKIWTGVNPPFEVFKEALDKCLFKI